MENYIHINGQNIPLTDKQIEQIKGIFAENCTALSSIPSGETFKIGEHEFIVLEHSKETTAVIRKDILCNMEFGNGNNFNGSYVDAKCAEFLTEIAGLIGKENIVLHTVDLMSNDGLKCYGKIRREVSLLTADLYRRYVDILDKHNPKKYWWLATPWSTKKRDSVGFVLCVSPSGRINFDFYCYCDRGVRPFCILNSSIFVSK